MWPIRPEMVKISHYSASSGSRTCTSCCLLQNLKFAYGAPILQLYRNIELGGPVINTFRVINTLRPGHCCQK